MHLLVQNSRLPKKVEQIFKEGTETSKIANKSQQLNQAMKLKAHTQSNTSINQNFKPQINFSVPKIPIDAILATSNFATNKTR